MGYPLSLWNIRTKGVENWTKQFRWEWNFWIWMSLKGYKVKTTWISLLSYLSIAFGSANFDLHVFCHFLFSMGYPLSLWNIRTKGVDNWTKQFRWEWNFWIWMSLKGYKIKTTWISLLCLSSHLYFHHVLNGNNPCLLLSFWAHPQSFHFHFSCKFHLRKTNLTQERFRL